MHVTLTNDKKECPYLNQQKLIVFQPLVNELFE